MSIKSIMNVNLYIHINMHSITDAKANKTAIKIICLK